MDRWPAAKVPMLPPQAIQTLGMGLDEVSPALSFGLDLNVEGESIGVEIVPSWVRVTRLSYQEAEGRLKDEPFRELYRLAQVYQARRRERGAVNIELPEVEIRVRDGEVDIRPLPSLKSRGWYAKRC